MMEYSFVCLMSFLRIQLQAIESDDNNNTL